MLFGIGVDIVQIERIERIWNRSGELLADTILTRDEHAQFRQERDPVVYLAGCFAAKEAIVKAMGTGFSEGIWVSDVGSVPDGQGGLKVVFSGRGFRKSRELGIDGGIVSLSQAKGSGFVCAMAILTARIS